MNRTIQVLLVDDHAVVRAGFKLLLAAFANIDVIAEAERGEQAIQIYRQSPPDIVVMDLSMPGIGGLETIRRIARCDASARILVFSIHDAPVYVRRALSAGANGYITKNSAPDILPAAIEAVCEGATYIEQGLLRQPNDRSDASSQKELIESLSAREFDVFRLLAQGLTVHRIAGELCLSHKTVANYATRIKKKMNVASIAELTRIAAVQGIAEL